MTHYSTKTYGHEEGLSAVFRQPNATHSHCSLLHGYSLGFRLVFSAEVLDDKNWVVDFGGLKKLKEWLKEMFDHKLVVAKDDPNLKDFLNLEEKGLADVVVMSGVGCEKFAEIVFHYANNLVQDMTNGRCKCVEVECMEHGANSGIYKA